MTAPPAAPAVGQLIFTNVESDRSPTRQRGFQVWLATPDLDAEQRRAIARRIDEFRLPVKADPAVERHAFFRLGADRFVVARTVPIDERDKFGRGGRYFAHAAVLGEAAFRQLDCDPFRIIDGGFRFLRHPADIDDETVKTGAPAPASVAPAEGGGEERALPAEFVADFQAHLNRKNERPVVVAEAPAAVLALLRGLFRLYPSRLRCALEFDTLSSGAALQQVKYPFVGGYSAEHLRLWTFRRFHRLDPATGTCTPPLEKAAGAMAGQLLAAPGWGALSADDKDALTGAAQALERLDLDGLKPDRLRAAANAVLAASPGFRERALEAAKVRLGRDVPATFLALPGVRAELLRYLNPESAEALPLLAVPVPRARVARVAADALERAGPGAPAEAVLRALEGWLRDDTEPLGRLGLYLRRWRGTKGDLAELGEALRGEGGEAGWLRGWLRTTLPADLCAGPAAWPGRLPIGRPVSPGLLRDAQLALALVGPEGRAEWEEARLLLAAHGGAGELLAALGKPPHSKAALSWLWKALQALLSRRCQFCTMSEGADGDYIGLAFSAADAAEEALFDAACAAIKGHAEKRELLWSLVPAAAGLKSSDETEPSVPKAISRLYGHVLKGAAPKEINAAAQAFRKGLREADDSAFRLGANMLLQMLNGQPVLREVGDGVYFLGLKLGWLRFERPQNFLALFEAVAGAVVAPLPHGTAPDPNRALTPDEHRRFSWLLARLENPVATQRLWI